MTEFAGDQNEPEAILRRAVLAEMPMVARLHRLAFFRAMPHMPALHTPEEDVRFFSTVVFPAAEVWLAERAGVAVGFIAYRPGWVDHLYIHPDYHGRGLGSMLLALAQAATPSLHLWTFQCNLRARRFYEKRGFRSELETDGANNEERQPDILYHWVR